jgi:hypothetical protein
MAQTDPSNTRSRESTTARPSVPRRSWLIWILFAGVIPLLFVVSRNNNNEPLPSMPRQQFIELFGEDRILKGAIHYNPQSSALTEITGVYLETSAAGRDEEKRFRLKTRLTDTLEARLLNSGRFEAAEPNTLLISLFYTLSPIILVALFVYFFFIRQIKLATGSANRELDDRQLFSPLDRVLIESAKKIAKPNERLFARMHLTDQQTVEGEILWVDANYIKYRSATEGREYILPKSSVSKFESAGS